MKRNIAYFSLLLLLLTSCPSHIVYNFFDYKIKAISDEHFVRGKRKNRIDGIEYTLYAYYSWIPVHHPPGEKTEAYPWGKDYRLQTIIELEIKNLSQCTVDVSIEKIKLTSKYYSYELRESESSTYFQGEINGKKDKNIYKVIPKSRAVISLKFWTKEKVPPRKVKPHMKPDEYLILYINGVKKGDKKISIPEIHLVP